MVDSETHDRLSSGVFLRASAGRGKGGDRSGVGMSLTLSGSEAA